MGLCLQCNKWINQPEGKRKKEFCNNTCRSNFWYGKNKKGKGMTIEAIKPIPKIAYDASPLPKNVVHDEPLSFDKLRAELPQETLFQSFQRQLTEAKYSEDLQKIGKLIQSSSLSVREKIMLQNIGQHIYNEKFNF